MKNQFSVDDTLKKKVMMLLIIKLKAERLSESEIMQNTFFSWWLSMKHVLKIETQRN